ncbi:hypothetical protein ACQP2U_43360 (plasmid) [Nocardia sp. CA-084685]|uniref:hypothetical protein n=1 Tax=Nocardia sp. CA-084685 TaxID=3239970 RepID=UPI003D95C6B2
MTTTTTTTLSEVDAVELTRITSLAHSVGLDSLDLRADVEEAATGEADPEQAADDHNAGLDTQLRYLIGVLGAEGTETLVREAADRRADTALAAIISSATTLRELRSGPSYAPDRWQHATTELVHALETLPRAVSAPAPDDPDAEFLRALHRALTDTPAMREQYFDRNLLLAVAAKQQFMLAARGAATAPMLCDNVEADPQFLVLYLELPADDDGFGNLGTPRQIARHIPLELLKWFLPHVEQVSATDSRAPWWDHSDKAETWRRMQEWVTTPTTGSDPHEPGADPGLPAPRVRASRYEVTYLPEDHPDFHGFFVEVISRGLGRWLVKDVFGRCYSRDGHRDLEPSRSTRTDAWCEQFWFTDLATAITTATHVAPALKVNGRFTLRQALGDTPVDGGGEVADS